MTLYSRKQGLVSRFDSGVYWYPASRFMVVPFTLLPCQSCCLHKTLMLIMYTECPVSKHCSPTLVGLSKFKCSLALILCVWVWVSTHLNNIFHMDTLSWQFLLILHRTKESHILISDALHGVEGSHRMLMHQV